MQFEWYVLNYNINKRKTEMFNIFSNYTVQEETEAAIARYLKNPGHFKFEGGTFLNPEPIYGFEGLVKEIDLIIRWQEWSRCEYEICAGEKYTLEIYDIVKQIDKYNTLEELKAELEVAAKRNSKLNYWDCYEQAKPNMVSIVHECIRQYKEQEQLKADGKNDIM